MNVGKGLLRIRQERNLTQREVARRAHLAASYVSRIENERLQPTMPTLRRLAEALGVTVSDVLGSPDEQLASTGGHCPATSSGRCIIQSIRSRHGPTPAGNGPRYGPEELHLLQLADRVALEGGPGLRRALAVVLESLVRELEPEPEA